MTRPDGAATPDRAREVIGSRGFHAARISSAVSASKRRPIKSNFLCNLGYGDPARLYERLPRLDFSEASKILWTARFFPDVNRPVAVFARTLVRAL